MTTNTPAPAMQDLPDFHSPEVQVVYETLCGIGPAPYSQHWEGWVSRHIVLALSKLGAPVAEPVATVMTCSRSDETGAMFMDAICEPGQHARPGDKLYLAAPVASAPVAGEAQPYGWLYDWTHRSATGRPDEHYTSFTKEEAHAKKHDNPRAVYLAAPQTGPSVAVEARPAGWQNALRIAELPEVDEALANFCDDSTLDNAVGLVLAVLGAAPQASEAQCSCPSGDGSLRHPCAVHPQASEAVPNEPLRVFAAGMWTYDGTGQAFSHTELDEAAFVTYRAALSAQKGGSDAE
jgi:hypothetical protein